MELPPPSRALLPANLPARFKRGAPVGAGFKKTAAALTTLAHLNQTAGFNLTARTGRSAMPKAAGAPRAKLAIHRSIRPGS